MMVKSVHPSSALLMAFEFYNRDFFAKEIQYFSQIGRVPYAG